MVCFYGRPVRLAAEDRQVRRQGRVCGVIVAFDEKEGEVARLELHLHKASAVQKVRNGRGRYFTKARLRKKKRPGMEE